MKFLTLEGVDGAGKSTHIEFIADAVRTKGAHVVVTREPGGTDLAERLRQTILAEPMPPVLETLLVFAARADHVARVLRRERDVKAGNYLLVAPLTPMDLLDKLTRGDVTQAEVRLIEGWTFSQFRTVLD